MRDYRDAKTMAQTLRDALSEKTVPINHSESLELIAKVFGLRDWNTLSAAIQIGRPHPTPKAALRRIKKRTTLPALPLRDVVVFPNSILSLYVGREKSVRALEKAMTGDHAVVLVTQKNAADDDPNAADIYRIGVLASVIHALDRPDGGMLVNVQGLQRVAIDQYAASGEFCTATVLPVTEDFGDREKTKVLTQELYRDFQSYAEARSPKVIPLLTTPDIDPGHLADIVATRFGLSVSEMQALLETRSVAKRLDTVLALLKQKGEPT